MQILRSNLNPQKSKFLENQLKKSEFPKQYNSPTFFRPFFLKRKTKVRKKHQKDSKAPAVIKAACRTYDKLCLGLVSAQRLRFRIS